jgi:hypothetical protein
MTCELAVLQRLRVWEEPTTSTYYGVSHLIGTPGDGLDVAAVEGSIKPGDDQETFDPKLATVYVDGHDEKVLGRKMASLGVSTPFHSHGVSLNGVNTVPTSSTWAQLLMLKAIMGGVSSATNGGARIVVAGASTTTASIEVTAGRGADFVAGQAVGVRVGSSASAIEVREIASIAGDVLTVSELFSAVPVTGAVVQGGVTVYLAEDPNTSLQFLLEGTETNDVREFCGMQGGFKLTLPINEVPQIAYDLKGALWTRSSGSIAAGTLAFLGMFAATFAELRVPTVGSTTRTAVDHSAFAAEVGIVYAPQKSGTGVNGIKRMRRQKTRPTVKGSFTTIFEDSTWEDHVTNKTDKRIDLQLGNVPGYTIMISQRTAQILPVKDAVHDTGIGGQMVPYESRIPSAASTALTRSVLALHFL